MSVLLMNQVYKDTKYRLKTSALEAMFITKNVLVKIKLWQMMMSPTFFDLDGFCHILFVASVIRTPH